MVTLILNTRGAALKQPAVLIETVGQKQSTWTCIDMWYACGEVSGHPGRLALQLLMMKTSGATPLFWAV